MTSLAVLAEQTASADLAIATAPDQQTAEHAALLNSLGLAKASKLSGHTSRIEAIKRAGFQVVTPRQAVEMLMGKPVTHEGWLDKQSGYEWTLADGPAREMHKVCGRCGQRQSGRNSCCYVGWQMMPQRHRRVSTFQHSSPDRVVKDSGFNPWAFVERYITDRRAFQPKRRWRCLHACLGDLRSTMPYGVALRIKELREAKIFDAFSAVAPEHLWDLTEVTPDPKVTDPVVLGEIWNPTGKGTTYFFVAMWK